jgi:beta-alanine degradation protein BauB
VADILEETSFDPGTYRSELDDPDEAVGTRLLFENERVRVWEIRLEPGERAPFHRHALPYFWSCVEGGTARQRFADGTLLVRRYEMGETEFSDHSANDAKVHDLENAGESVVRFVTVELTA